MVSRLDNELAMFECENEKLLGQVISVLNLVLNFTMKWRLLGYWGLTYKIDLFLHYNEIGPRV